MKTIAVKIASLSLLVATSAVSVNAYACAWHGGGMGGGYYGSQWRQYSPDEIDALIEATYKKTAANDAAAQQHYKAKPTFSNSASRAVETAKERVAEGKSDDKATSDDEGASSQ